MRISANFTLDELLRSPEHPELAARGIDLPHEIIVNLCRLTFLVLQPLRDRFGPIIVHSGFRSVRLNEAVNGADHSTHLDGRAGDISFVRTPYRDAWAEIRSGRLKIDFDRIASYPDGHFHVEVAESESEPRRLLYEATPAWVRVES